MKTNIKTLCAMALLAVSTSMAAQEATDTTVIIGETGYLPVKVSKPFSGPSNLIICTTNASNNAATTDIRYYTWRADTVVAMATDYILVGQPGTYTLKYEEAATLKGSSNLSWTDEPTVTDTRNSSNPNLRRILYKFINTKEKLGFERNEDYASVFYNTLTFAEGEHIYLSIPTAVADKIAAASGKTDHNDLDFIVWHGPTPEDAATAGITDMYNSTMYDVPFVYDLQGRKIVHGTSSNSTSNGKSIIIRNGKKYISK